MTTTTASRQSQISQREQSFSLRSPASQIKIAAELTVGFALLIVLGSHTATDGPVRWLADLLVWPLGDKGPVTDEAQLTAAILGGVMAGWGVLLYMLTNALASKEPALLQRLIYGSMAVWFVIDGLGSLAAGGWLNVIANLGFLLMFVVPARRLT